MTVENSNLLYEVFTRILKKLGRMGDFFTLADELSNDGSGGYIRLFRWLMTQPSYANLKTKIVNQQFFVLITKLANLDHQHEEADLPSSIYPSTQISAIIDDPELIALLSQLTDKDDLREMLIKQGTTESILFSDLFSSVAAKLANDDEMTKLVQRMQEDENHQNVARMLKTGGDSAEVILSVAEDPDYAETVKRMCEDKVHPDGFNDLVKQLRTNPEFFELSKQMLSSNEVIRDTQDLLSQRPLNSKAVSNQLCILGDKFRFQDENNEAILTYKMAISLDPNSRQAYLGHAQASLAKSDYTQSVEDYKTLISMNDQDTEAYLEMGKVYLLMNKEANECFRKVLEMSTDEEERKQAEAGLSDSTQAIYIDTAAS